MVRLPLAAYDFIHIRIILRERALLLNLRHERRGATLEEPTLGTSNVKRQTTNERCFVAGATGAAKTHGQILHLIEQRKLGPGDRLPTEDSLSKGFGVSRPTLREALRQLERDQVIYCIHGRGRFIATDLQRYRDSITQLRSVTEMARALGFRLTTRVLNIQKRLPSAEEARQLELASEERVIELERARYAETNPLIYSVDVFPERLVKGLPGQNAWGGSLVHLMESWGVRLAYSQTTIHATLLPAKQAGRLGVERKLPWILLVQLNFGGDRRPQLFSRDFHRGDKFSFQVTRYRGKVGEEDRA
jgi:GntR family transcriptional regulator